MTFLPRLRLVLLLVFPLLVAGSGCGPKRPTTVPIRGLIMLDGKPVAGAAVMLMPQFDGRPALGVTSDSGEFTLTTFTDGDGAMPGKHIVTVTLQRTTGFVADKDGLSGGVAPEGVRQEWLVPQRYSDPKTSGLTAEVKAGMQPLRWELTSK